MKVKALAQVSEKRHKFGCFFFKKGVKTEVEFVSKVGEKFTFFVDRQQIRKLLLFFCFPHARFFALSRSFPVSLFSPVFEVTFVLFLFLLFFATMYMLPWWNYVPVDFALLQATWNILFISVHQCVQASKLWTNTLSFKKLFWEKIYTHFLSVHNLVNVFCRYF